MKIHYYSGWYDGALPTKLAASLHKDIVDKSSIAIIWGAWGIEEYANIAKNHWLGPAGIVFEKYHEVDTRMSKEAAQDAVKNASAILLTGGHTVPQMEFIKEYGLDIAIKESSASIVIGISAGAYNMGKKCISVIDSNYESEERAVYECLGLDDFAYESYFSLENRRRHALDSSRLIKEHLLPLSEEIDIYATGDGAAFRVENGVVQVVIGDVHLISNSEIHKI
ncbi:MAG: Type 1 glutamine amidotransferase-like domain-containing protein [Defluviitaleaceae bacterium]|nr:Type 1 glutamine amidotransferase-like domain-containing protein [Defluviitaleaceae bacterium]